MVKVLRQMGKKVDFLSGEDIPDLLVITPGRNVPVFVCFTIDDVIDVANMNLPMATIEVKMPGMHLKPGQVEWHDEAKNVKKTDS